MISLDNFRSSLFVGLLILCFACNVSCQDKSLDEDINTVTDEPINEPSEIIYKLPNIDLNHWKVTLPIGNPTEVSTPEILKYSTNETLKPFFYNDSINGALVFYAFPNATTSNTSYSRCELREQMVSGSDLTNWTFAEGGTMKGTLSLGDISKDNAGDYPKVIIMQIHGRLTNDQRDLIGADDNNAPPMLKIYWINGFIKVKTKVLKNIDATYEEILKTSAWGDDDGYTFSEYVGFDKFTLEVKVSDGSMKIILNNNATVVYNDTHIQKWGVFENYFKAGNYLNTLDEDAYAYVKYYELLISH